MADINLFLDKLRCFLDEINTSTKIIAESIDCLILRKMNIFSIENGRTPISWNRLFDLILLEIVKYSFVIHWSSVDVFEFVVQALFSHSVESAIEIDWIVLVHELIVEVAHCLFLIEWFSQWIPISLRSIASPIVRFQVSKRNSLKKKTFENSVFIYVIFIGLLKIRFQISIDCVGLFSHRRKFVDLPILKHCKTLVWVWWKISFELYRSLTVRIVVVGTELPY